ncbi:MAG: histidine--tRNA ligase [Candidatus Thorarchaeota archaeon]|nr:MAG: histidine--tRNA ligase [Candidatus Thorarchaeota archaeon]
MSEMRTVRGMRDLMGPEILVRNYLLDLAEGIFQLYGYEPLDSPVMELWETLSAKGGEEVEAETFKFKDKGDRDVGLRFDLTVPLARIVASNPHLPKPFRRYAIGKAWRYDRPQAGRYREFMQADVDVIGSLSPSADAEVVLVALEFFREVLGEDYVVRVNNRKVLRGLTEKAGIEESRSFECFRAIDRLDRIGRAGVLEELKTRGFKSDQSEFLVDAIDLKGEGSKILPEFRELLSGSSIGTEGVEELEYMAEIFAETTEEGEVEFDMSLARGLDYYTGPVFEAAWLGEPKVGAISGGGRYDKLVERFGGPATAATGISIGIDRIIDIALARGLAANLEGGIDVYIAPIKRPMVKFAMKIRSELVQAGASCDIDLMERPLKKLLEIADSRKAKLVVIVGQKDLEKGSVSVRDMATKETSQVAIDQITYYVMDKTLEE